MKESLKETSKLLRQVNRFIAHGNFQKAIELIETELPRTENLNEMSDLFRKLAHLYRFNGTSLDATKKAINYAILAGESYIRAGRMAPAVAMLSWLKELPEAKQSVIHLHTLIARTFSMEQPFIHKPDEEMPVPTPYQELQASVTFDDSDIELARIQWSDVPTKRITFFSSLKAHEVSRLIQFASIRELVPNSVIFHEGDSPEAFYVVAEGEMELSSSKGFRKTFREGDFFGEVALFGKMKRTATLRTVHGATLLEFSQEALEQCFKEFPSLETRVMNFYELRLFQNVASRSELFRGFSASELEDCFDFFTSIHIPPGRVLINVGGASDRFYFIAKGYCEIEKENKVVSRLGPGQFVGEVGLIFHSSRTAKVTSITDCYLLECHESVFREMIKMFPQLAKILEEVARLRDPNQEITDKIVID